MSNLAESKVSTSAVQAASQKVTNQLAASKAVVKEVTSATLTNKGFDIQYNQAIPAGAKIMFAVWSEVNGQDGLIWYTADSNSHAIAKYTGTYGLYNIHTYQNLNGQMKGLNALTIDVPKPSAKAKITKESSTTYKVTITDVPVYIDSIQVPTWTEKNGQDDIQWYKATKAADGSYYVIFSEATHNLEAGTYNVHVYGNSRVTNSQTALLGTRFESDYQFGDVKVQASLGQNGINISMPSDVSPNLKVMHAVWSESDQSNLHWYTTSDVYDGVVTVMVNEKNHGYIKGNYTVHVYVDFTDNTTSGFNLGQYALNADEPAQHAPSYFIDISSHNGVISVSDYQRLKSQGITGVVVKLTEGTSYTNPYARAQIANAQAAGLRVSAYHYSHYETAAEARAEAQYFVRVAQSMGLSGSTTMVNDMEERSMLNGDLNANTQVWKDEMNHLGYSNNVYYTMASWLDTKGGKLNTAKFVLSNLWVAHYLYAYTYLDQESAKSLSYYSNTAAWQYTSVSPKLLHALDESIDYTGRFTW